MLATSSIEMGSNDLYLIKKLRESGITVEKLDYYLRKIFLAIKESTRVDQEKKNDVAEKDHSQFPMKPIF
jgi:hypothetical protein